MQSSSITYDVRIDGGEVQQFTCRTGFYSLAALAAVACLSDKANCMIEISIPDLVPDYGPYLYAVGPDPRATGFIAVPVHRRAALAKEGK